MGQYLKATADKGITLYPNDHSFDCFANAHFAGNQVKEGTEWDADTTRLQTGFVIMYAGCLIVWASKLQTEIALSTTEAEYIAFSQALQEVIPLMDLCKELNQAGVIQAVGNLKVHCRLFEDKTGAAELTIVHKYRSCTKHINVNSTIFKVMSTIVASPFAPSAQLIKLQISSQSQ